MPHRGCHQGKRQIYFAWSHRKGDDINTRIFTHLNRSIYVQGNDQVRFELGCYALHHGVKFLAPWREDDFLKKFVGRQQLLDYAAEKNIPVKATKDKSYSEDDNLMHIRCDLF